jgi:hypothetical protein
MDALSNLNFTTSGALIELVDSAQIPPLLSRPSADLDAFRILPSRLFPLPFLPLHLTGEQRRYWYTFATTEN